MSLTDFLDALISAFLLAGIYAAMKQPPERFGAIMMHVPGLAFMVLPFQPFWNSARAGHLNVGDAAPDFELPTLDHKSTMKLSAEYASKPVVLIFGLWNQTSAMAWSTPQRTQMASARRRLRPASGSWESGFRQFSTASRTRPSGRIRGGLIGDT